jgi:DNA-binding response OmpR family regulator
MKALVAEDDPFFRNLLQQVLSPQLDLVITEDGMTAWDMLREGESPMLAILDWVMPGMAGPEVCRAVRANPKTAGNYLILLTAKNSAADIVAGLRAGADDYVTKPVEPEDLRARVHLGCRILELQALLATNKTALEEALRRERSLQARLRSLEGFGTGLPLPEVYPGQH